VALFCTACVTPWAKFYRGQPNARSLSEYDSSANEEPVIYTATGDIGSDVEHLIQVGYLQFGQSSFNSCGQWPSEGDLRDQARAIGAHLVLISSHYNQTASEAATTHNQAVARGLTQMKAPVTRGDLDPKPAGEGPLTAVLSEPVSCSDFTAIYFFQGRSRRGSDPSPFSNNASHIAPASSTPAMTCEDECAKLFADGQLKSGMSTQECEGRLCHKR